MDWKISYSLITRISQTTQERRDKEHWGIYPKLQLILAWIVAMTTSREHHLLVVIEASALIASLKSPKQYSLAHPEATRGKPTWVLSVPLKPDTYSAPRRADY